MDLYLMRHGIAVPKNIAGVRDEDRPLTPRGKKQLRVIAQALTLLKVRFDIIVTSPILRARQTAHIVADSIGYKHPILESSSLATGAHDNFIQWLKEQMRSKNRALIVGHEPYLGELAGILIAGTPKIGVSIKKGGVAFIEIPNLIIGQCGVLRWLLTPNIMSKMLKEEHEDS